MSFFTEIIQAAENPSEAEQALIDAICLSAVADNILDEREFAGCVEYAEELLSTTREQALARVTRTFERLRKDGFEKGYRELVAELQKHGHDIARAAFLATAAIQYADDFVTVEEEHLLNRLGKALDIQGEEMKELVEKARDLHTD